MSMKWMGQPTRVWPIDGEVVSVKDPRFGAVGDGTADDTDIFTTAFGSGGKWYVPEGDYLIAGAGADAGGVEVELTADLEVVCHPNARFFTDSLDNDFFRFTVPSDGTGLPSRGIKVIWRGGRFDQSSQKNSTVIPHSATYSGADVGSSATTDAISIRGEYTSGTVQCGVSYAEVSGVDFYAGDHWETAGGDSAIFIGSGCKVSQVFGCTFTGCRDLGVYGSRDSTGVAGGPVHVYGNRFENCFFAVAMKRSLSGFSIFGNEAINCVTAWQVSHVAGSGTTGGHIYGNREEQCLRSVALEYCVSVKVDLGEHADVGATDASGTKVTGVYSAYAVALAGARNCVVSGGRFASKNSAWSAENYRIVELSAYDPGSGAVDSQYNTIEDNIALTDFYGVGTEVSGEADYNLYKGNLAFGGTAPNMVVSGSNSVEERRTAAGAKTYRNPVGFSDGSASAPAVQRADQTNTGIFFDTNKVAISVGGIERFSITNSNAPKFGTHTVLGAETVTGYIEITDAAGNARKLAVVS